MSKERRCLGRPFFLRSASEHMFNCMYLHRHWDRHQQRQMGTVGSDTATVMVLNAFFSRLTSPADHATWDGGYAGLLPNPPSHPTIMGLHVRVETTVARN